MGNTDEFIENTLQHWGYDPRKAHEYYIRTRKLLGRKPNNLTPQSFDINLNSRLDTSQIQDKRAKKDPSRGVDPVARYNREDTLNEQRRKGVQARAAINKNMPSPTESKHDQILKKLEELDQAAENLPSEIKKKFKSRLDKIRGKLRSIGHDPFPKDTTDWSKSELQPTIRPRAELRP